MAGGYIVPFQFDWSEDWAIIDGVRTKLQVAHFKLSYSRAFFVRAFIELFKLAGVGVDVTDDIASALWEKLLLAGSVGAVATACSVPVGTLLADPQRRAMLQAVMEEVSSVAAARNVRLPGDLVPNVMGFVESFPPDVTSSLQRDLETGQPSEYEALVGIALRWAEDAGVAVPTLRSVDGMIRARGLL